MDRRFRRPTTERDRAIDEFAADLPPVWGETRFDAPTGLGALAYLHAQHPRVLYVMLGETDEWAHSRRYDLYLDAAQRNDRFIKRLWEEAQAMPDTPIAPPSSWQPITVAATQAGTGPITAGRFQPLSESGWPSWDPPSRRPALRSNVTVTQSQIAATVAALLGQDYRSAQPKAAPPLDFGR